MLCCMLLMHALVGMSSTGCTDAGDKYKTRNIEQKNGATYRIIMSFVCQSAKKCSFIYARGAFKFIFAHTISSSDRTRTHTHPSKHTYTCAFNLTKVEMARFLFLSLSLPRFLCVFLFVKYQTRAVQNISKQNMCDYYLF